MTHRFIGICTKCGSAHDLAMPCPMVTGGEDTERRVPRYDDEPKTKPAMQIIFNGRVIFECDLKTAQMQPGKDLTISFPWPKDES